MDAARSDLTLPVCERASQRLSEVQALMGLTQPFGGEAGHLLADDPDAARSFNLAAQLTQPFTVDATGGHQLDHSLECRAQRLGNLASDLGGEFAPGFRVIDSLGLGCCQGFFKGGGDRSWSGGGHVVGAADIQHTRSTNSL